MSEHERPTANRAPEAEPLPAYRRRRRALVLVVILTFAIGVAGAAADARRMLADPTVPTVDIFGRPGTPKFAFSVTGSEEDPLQRPVSVAVTDERVYVTDSLAGRVSVFHHGGSPVRSIGEDRLEVPLYTAVDPTGEELYVSDRALAAVLAFSTADGSFVETITPSYEGTDTVLAWRPVAVEAADDGSLFVSDIASEHRVWHVERDGTIIDSLPASGTAGPAIEFDFPNAVKSIGERVWVADSNSRRLLEFGPGGTLVRLLPLGRLIRGFDVVLAEEGAPVYFALADAFSHEVVLVSEAGSEVARFGGGGTGGGQLSFPNDVVVHAGVTWIVDTGNARVQAWEWGDAARIAAAALWSGGPSWVGVFSAILVLSPLALLFLLRRVRAAVSPEAIPMLSVWSLGGHWGRVRLYVAPSAGDPPHAETLPLIEMSPVSRSDVAFIAQVYSLEEEQAETLSIALRVRMLVTEDETLAIVARARGVEVYDPGRFADEFCSEGTQHSGGELSE
ncbi:MAG: hypothetical protein RQ731_04955 [Anaerosomatales bacterium]|nr:hypothetical protein [Anaerosomatales bacterium]MDT8434086.1 hypothetical protein [Anaerosomatales bacterium]